MSTVVTAPVPPGKEHVPQFPRGFEQIRITQLILGLGVLGLTSYGVGEVPNPHPGICLLLATAIFTIIGSTYYILAEFNPKLYNYWATMALDSFILIMWIVSVVIFAPALAKAVDYDEQHGGLETLTLCMLAAEVTGGLLIILYAITLGITSVAVHSHREAGLHTVPITPAV